MSKKDRKIKKLKREVKELKAELRKLKAASAGRRRTKVASALKSLPKPKSSSVSKSPSVTRSPAKPAEKSPAKSPSPETPAPALGGIDTPAEMAMTLRNVSAAGQG